MGNFSDILTDRVMERILKKLLAVVSLGLPLWAQPANEDPAIKLQNADALAALYNWIAAAPLYAEAERSFIRQHDRLTRSSTPTSDTCERPWNPIRSKLQQMRWTKRGAHLLRAA